MSIERLISHSIPTLTTADTISRALEIFDESALDGLPVLNGDDYAGFVTENQLLELPDEGETLEHHIQYKPAVPRSAHPFDAIATMHQASLSLLPVVDHEGRYHGCIDCMHVIDYIAEYSGVSNPGGVLVLEIPPRNYSMFEIARICENEDVTLLAMHSHTKENGMLELTMKLNRTVLDAVVSSFQRHNYHVVEVYGKQTDKEDVMDKYNLLMNYLNM